MTKAMMRFWWFSVALVWPLVSGAQPWRTDHSALVFEGTTAQELALFHSGENGRCVQNLRQLQLAGYVYSLDHNAIWPGIWQDLTNGYLHAPAPLYCPADTQHPPQSDWREVDFSAVSYDLVSPGATAGVDPHTAFARCRVHGNIIQINATVQQAHPYEPRGFPAAAAGALAFPAPTHGASYESRISCQCQDQLRQLGLASRVFAIDNADHLPTEWSQVAESLDSPATLVCPSEALTVIPTNFAALDPLAVSYLLDAPGTSDAVVQQYAHCRVHGHLLNTDGTVVAGTNRFPPRLIIGHPLSRTMEPGETDALAVLTGDPALGPFRFQWRRQQPFDTFGNPFTNTVVITGATNATLLITNAQSGDEGYYDVIVYDGNDDYQVSALACVRVQPISTVVPDRSWETNACAANLREIYLAVQMAGVTTRSSSSPPGLDALPAYTGWPVALFCPSDRTRVAPNSWDAIDFEETSYVLCRKIPFAATNAILATCKIHGFQVRVDGMLLAPGTESLAPRLEILPASAAQPAVLVVSGLDGTKCIVESSPDLERWAPMNTNVLAGGRWQWTIPDLSGQASRFYRASVR